jgi:hypothetical protein
VGVHPPVSCPWLRISSSLPSYTVNTILQPSNIGQEYIGQTNMRLLALYRVRRLSILTILCAVLFLSTDR